MEKDIFSRGFWSGAIAGIVMNLWSFLSGALQITDLRIVDWTAIIVFAHIPPFEGIEIGIAFFANIFFNGVLGIAFAYMLPLIKSNKIYFKGWTFSLTVWFAIYAVTTVYKIEGTMPISIGTTISNLIGASAHGWILAFITTKFLFTEEKSLYKVNLVPAMKPLDNSEDEEKENH